MIGVVLGTGWKDSCLLPDGVERIWRTHPYEGFGIESVRQPIHAAAMTGVDTLVLTNAAGACNPDLEVGEVVCISDHINLSGLPAATKFTSMSGIYTRVEGFRQGVFVQLPGPAFETAAEVRMLRTMGADMVGMSTALEAGYAHELGLRVIGLSFISNMAGTAECHEDVLAAASATDLAGVLDGVLSTLH